MARDLADCHYECDLHIIFHSAKKNTYFDQTWRENCSLDPAVAWRGLTGIIPLSPSLFASFFLPLSSLSAALQRFIYYTV